MTQSIKTTAAILFLSIGIFTLSFGQNMVATHTSNKANDAIVFKAVEKNTSESAMEANFSALFPNATQQKWNNTANNYFVPFLNNGRKASASFNANGKMNYVITNCGINDLPAAFAKTIKNNYAGYQLFNGSEIMAHGHTAYQAVIESSNAFITLKYTEDGTEEIQKVNKPQQ